MKAKLFSISVIFSLLIVASCKQELYSGEYQKSYNNWIKFKQESKNSYKYSVIQGSVFGPSAETVIYVRDGAVVKRTYKATQRDAGSPPKFVVTEEWTEEQASLNSHQYGAAALTLDDIYAKAKTDWLTKRDNAKTYFESKNDGMISSAGYVPDGCQDDCFTGITIGYILKDNEDI